MGNVVAQLIKANRCMDLNEGRTLSQVREAPRADAAAETMLRIRREFGKSLEWLLTGEERKSTREDK